MNSLDTYPNVVRLGSDLYYINSSHNPAERFTLYMMKADGTGRKPLLTAEQCLEAYRKINPDTKLFCPVNIQAIKDGRIIFSCLANEKVTDKTKYVLDVYVCSVDLTGSSLQVIKAMGMKGDEWYGKTGNSETFIREYTPPIIKDGWRYDLDEKKRLIREKPNGTGMQVIYDKAPVDMFDVQGSLIYFIAMPRDCIYRMPVNGGDVTPLKDPGNEERNYGAFRVYGKWIYYCTVEAGCPLLRRLKADGSADELIPAQYTMFSFQIIEGRIFYTYLSKDPNTGSNTAKRVLRSMKLDGTDDRPIDTPQE